MRKILEVPRLKLELYLVERAIAASCGVHSTVQNMLKRFRDAQLT